MHTPYHTHTHTHTHTYTYTHTHTHTYTTAHAVVLVCMLLSHCAYATTDGHACLEVEKKQIHSRPYYAIPLTAPCHRHMLARRQGAARSGKEGIHEGVFGRLRASL